MFALSRAEKIGFNCETLTSEAGSNGTFPESISRLATPKFLGIDLSSRKVTRGYTQSPHIQDPIFVSLSDCGIECRKHRTS